MKKLAPLALGAAFLTGAAVFYANQPRLPESAVPFAAQAETPAADTTTEADAPAEIIEMTLGAEDAPITFIEYASFTCPHCATFHLGPMKELKRDYVDTGKVKLIYRDVYFDKFGLWASLIARCGGPEKFFGLTDLIYKSQSDWARAGSEAAIAQDLRKIGRLAGIEEEALETCLTDKARMRALVGWYQANAEADGITATPSFVIDGELQKNVSYDELKQILDAKLEQ